MLFRKKPKPTSADIKPQPAREMPKAPRTKQSLLSLEPRLMFDAAAATTAAEVNQEQVAQEQAESAVSAEGSGEPSVGASESQALLQAIMTYNSGESTTEVVFVDPTVPNYRELLNGMNPDIEVILLDGGQDGVEQMASALVGRTGIDAIHVISHGDAGTLQLGTGTLNIDSMSGQYVDELATIQQALSGQADILVYGCDFAEGDVGQAAVNQLALLTGADVAASTDDTGYAGLGGDWDLEIQTGTVETEVAIDYHTQVDWVGLLAGETPPTITNLSGDTRAYSEGAGAVVIESGNAVVADVDSTNFDTGTLSVSIPAGGDPAEDVLSIRHQGTGAGQIGVSGSTVTYGGVSIGTFTGGSGGNNLVITFNASATPTAVTALVRNITYQNTDTNAPTTGARTVRFALTDGDGGASPTYDTTVTVSAVNDAPTDLSLLGDTVAENANNGTVVGIVSGTDPDSGDTKTYSLTDTAGGRFAINSATGEITVADGSLLNYETAMSHSVTVRVTDSGGLTYDEAFTINLTNVNESPTGADATITIVEDTARTLTTANFGFSDVDAGDSLSAVRIDTLPGAGMLTLSGTSVTAGQIITVADLTAGNLVFTPSADANGTGYATFTFSVRDSNNVYDATPNTLTIDVTPVNDAPMVAVNSGSTVAEGGTDTISSGELTVTDVEHAAAQLTYSIGTGPAYGRLELTTAPGVSTSTFTQADIAANRLVYAHDGSETTSDSFTFTVSDGVGGTLGATTMTLTITPVNDTPTITSGGGASTAAVNVAENVSAVTIVTGADVDLPAQTLTYGLSGGADQARFTINAVTGALNFTAPPDFEVATDANGDNVYVVQVQVIDSQGASTTQTIQVTVTNVAEGAPPAPLPPPVLLPTTPTGPTGLGPISPRPAEPPIQTTEVPTTLPVEASPSASPPKFTPTGTTPSGTERLNPIRSEEPRKTIDVAKDSAPFHWIDETRRLLLTGTPVEATPTPESEPAEPSQSVSDLLFSKLDEMTASLEQAMGVSQEQHAIMVRIAALTGTTLSSGFIVWALRSGTLLASCLATMPVWRHFDPLPVLGGSGSERERRRKEAERDRQAEATEFKGLKHVLDFPPDPKP